MIYENNQGLCPEHLLAGASQTANEDTKTGLTCLDALLKDYGQDPRLHFLRGSLLAGLTQYRDARQAMQTAVDIDPNFILARFQLGFLEYTSGDVVAADNTWGQLKVLPDTNPIRLFVEGLEAMAQDQFPEAVDKLAAGIARNVENMHLNENMQLIIDTLREQAGKLNLESEPISATHLFLQAYGGKKAD